MSIQHTFAIGDEEVADAASIRRRWCVGVVGHSDAPSAPARDAVGRVEKHELASLFLAEWRCSATACLRGLAPSSSLLDDSGSAGRASVDFGSNSAKCLARLLGRLAGDVGERDRLAGGQLLDREALEAWGDLSEKLGGVTVERGAESSCHRAVVDRVL